MGGSRRNAIATIFALLLLILLTGHNNLHDWSDRTPEPSCLFWLAHPVVCFYSLFTCPNQMKV